MSEISYSVPSLKTLEELEQAIQRYRTSDLSNSELLSQWQAIRDASLNQNFSDYVQGNPAAYDQDMVPGGDSY